MQAWAHHTYDLAHELLPVMAAFALLTVLVKRRAIIAAMRRSQRETMTNIGLVALNSVFLAPFIVLPKAWLEASPMAPVKI